MWKLFPREMGTVILKTCGTVRRGKSRRRRFPRDSGGPALSPQRGPRAPAGEGPVLRGKHAGLLEQTSVLAEQTRGKDGPSQRRERQHWTWRSTQASGQQASLFQENASSPGTTIVHFCLLRPLLDLEQALAPSRNSLRALEIS